MRGKIVTSLSLQSKEVGCDLMKSLMSRFVDPKKQFKKTMKKIF